MAKEVEEIWILAPVDQILTDYLALPPIKKLLDILPTPKRVLKTLGLPTLDEVVVEAAEKFVQSAERMVK